MISYSLPGMGPSPPPEGNVPPRSLSWHQYGLGGSISYTYRIKGVFLAFSVLGGNPPIPFHPRDGSQPPSKIAGVSY